MSAPPYLIGCGILEREIRFLLHKNCWDLQPFFLPSGLHVDFAKLEHALCSSLAHQKNRSGLVFYGACHPNMDQFLAAAQTTRTLGQNCVDIYLGHETFCRELENGAFFLFEDWAHKWEDVVGKVMPGNPQIMRDIFRSSHTYLLAIRTPCSGDFSAAAHRVSELTSLPLRWLDVGLEHLEKNLLETLKPMENLL